MSDLEKITIALTPEMAEAIGTAIREGEYTSAGEAVRDALRLWMRERRFEEMRLKAILDDGDEEGSRFSIRRLVGRGGTE
jgi:antitoxin ParD1/3/4